MSERGVVLLEVLVAIVILSMIGASSMGFIAASLETESRLADREAEMVRAERVLTTMALLSRGELDQRIGVREVSDFAVWVDRPEPSLFRVGVAPAGSPGAEVLSTLVYRPVGSP